MKLAASLKKETSIAIQMVVTASILIMFTVECGLQTMDPFKLESAKLSSR